MTKRMTLAVLGALALIAGLVGGPAMAGDPYPGTVDTTTRVDAPASIKAGKSAKIEVSVRTGGSGRAEGRVTVSIDGPGGFSKTMSQAYEGERLTVRTGKLKKVGTYKVVAKFTGGDSVFRDSKDAASIAVKKKKG